MKLVKIKLSESPFWFLGKAIKLNRSKPFSDLINVDSLSDEDKKIIDKSISRCEIKLFDSEGNRIPSLEEAGYIRGEFSVSLEDIKEDQSDTVPEVFSVTVGNDDEDEEDEILEPTETDYENAELILSKNGNTVKKIIKETSDSEEGLSLLHACLTIEKQNKNRIGIINSIEQRIMEF